MRVVLASKSEIRRRLLNTAGFQLECIESETDESIFVDLDPGKRALSRAKAKAESVAKICKEKFKNEEIIVIGADQVLWMEGQFFSKAKSKDEAVNKLFELQSKEHSLFTGCCVIHISKSTKDTFEHLVRTDMSMRALSMEQIKKYIATGEGLKSVGCYEFENQGVALFEAVRGDVQSIPGIPVMWVIENLLRLGVKPVWMT